jgi:hypothetical protein
MPPLIQTLALAFPLNWYTKCYQAIALRGAPLTLIGNELGALLILTGIFSLFLVICIKKAESHEIVTGDFENGKLYQAEQHQ